MRHFGMHQRTCLKSRETKALECSQVRAILHQRQARCLKRTIIKVAWGDHSNNHEANEITKINKNENEEKKYFTSGRHWDIEYHEKVQPKPGKLGGDGLGPGHIHELFDGVPTEYDPLYVV